MQASESDLQPQDSENWRERQTDNADCSLSIEKFSGNLLLTIEALAPRAIEAGIEARLNELLQQDSGALTEEDVLLLEKLLPPGSPLPSQIKKNYSGTQKRYGGLSKRISDKDVAVIYTISRTVSRTVSRTDSNRMSPSQTNPSGGSRSALVNLLDYWILKPLGGSVQIIHGSVTGGTGTFDGVEEIEAYLNQRSRSRESNMSFQSSAGTIIAAAKAQANKVTLQLALLRRIGSKPIPFFYSTLENADSPQLVSSAKWKLADKSVLALITSSGEDRSEAAILAFNAKEAKFIQTMSGAAIEVMEDLGQLGLVIKEPLGQSGINRPVFYMFSNSAGQMTELKSLRAPLCLQELQHLKFEARLKEDLPPAKRFAIATLMIDCQGELAEQGLKIVNEMKDSPALKADKKLYQSIKSLLKEIERRK
ncbi:MAG: hypothetical protein K2Y32_12970 [Candidatus Obscuribacterales bacterium]|nr:hypothetical protein [Candidatus Obscuribacterales bacterium]